MNTVNSWRVGLRVAAMLLLGGCDTHEDSGGGATGGTAGGWGGGGGGGAEISCEPNGQCSSYLDCCPGEDCLFESQCAGSCDPTAACSSRFECCHGQFCVDGRCDDLCGLGGSTCDADADCCGGACEQGLCVEPSADTGDPCSSDAECFEGECVGAGWCSPASCNSDSDCGFVNSQGMETACVAGQCAPLCFAHAECANYKHHACVPYPDDGGYASICLGDSTTAHQDVGDFCSFDAQCTTGDCVGWCIDGCSTNQDCGINEDGNLVFCVGTNSGNKCFPSCDTNADCAMYGSSYSCQYVGSGVSVCSA